MADDEELPYEIIECVLAASPDECADVSIELIQILADSLSDIIGDEGFESLLFRVFHRVGRDFPWLQFDPRTRSTDPEFELLWLRFERQEPVDVRAASILLFTTLVDILVLLVGAHLTKLILNSALGRARAGNISKEQ